jgi:GT2 family glycosyltransferase
VPDRPTLATVVIVNYNGGHLLPACLTALRGQTMPAADFAVWVVDNASSDGSVAMLRRDFPEVRVLESARNLGFAGGNNLALRQVRTPFAVLLNPDTVAEPDWLTQLLGPFTEPGSDRIAAVCAKVVFLPRFARLRLDTPVFHPGGADPRELGVRVFGIEADGLDVVDRTLWERLSYGPEGPPGAQFRWTRPSGELLVPLPASGPVLEAPTRLRFRWVAERTKPVRLDWVDGGAELTVHADPRVAEVTLPAGLPLLDVVNNAGGVVFVDGYGADRGYQHVDDGSFDEPVDVFTCGGTAVAFRSAAGAEAGWFDDDFFLYYEDTDLGWRLRARGWTARYQPKATVRHHHSALTREFSPLWTFHVDRNRLLMLTKNATARLAAEQVLRYHVTTASMTVRALRQWLSTRRRPAVGHLVLRGRVTASYLRLLPVMLRRRRAVARGAVVDRRALQCLLTPR